MTPAALDFIARYPTQFETGQLRMVLGIARANESDWAGALELLRQRSDHLLWRRFHPMNHSGIIAFLLFSMWLGAHAECAPRMRTVVADKGTSGTPVLAIYSVGDHGGWDPRVIVAAWETGDAIISENLISGGPTYWHVRLDDRAVEEMVGDLQDQGLFESEWNGRADVFLHAPTVTYAIDHSLGRFSFRASYPLIEESGTHAKIGTEIIELDGVTLAELLTTAPPEELYTRAICEMILLRAIEMVEGGASDPIPVEQLRFRVHWIDAIPKGRLQSSLTRPPPRSPSWWTCCWPRCRRRTGTRSFTVRSSCTATGTRSGAGTTLAPPIGHLVRSRHSLPLPVRRRTVGRRCVIRR